MENKNNKSVVIAIIAMMFLFAMISFVTNMAAPFGTIWKFQYSWAGMMGNMMNFAAYLFMGIPAGMMITKMGYKKTALVGLALGFIGICVQFLSSRVGAETAIFGGLMNLNYLIYLTGAFICGFCVCILNTVVNPMLNLLGGGGNKGNQYIQIGGSLNSLSGTLTPMLAGVLIGEVTKATSMSDVAPLLYIAMAVFALSFVIIFFTPLVEPEQEAGDILGSVKGALRYKHLIFGVISIFFYVGIEIGIPGEMIFYLNSAEVAIPNAAAIAGSIAAIYWFLMLVGRFTSSFISGKVSTRTQLVAVSSVALVLLLLAIFVPQTVTIKLPKMFDKQVVAEEVVAEEAVAEETVAFEEAALAEEPVEEVLAQNEEVAAEELAVAEEIAQEEVVAAEPAVEETPAPAEGTRVPLKCLFLILCGLCTSVMWGGIFNLATEGLGKYTAAASGLFMTMVVGGGVMPLIQDAIARSTNYMTSYWLVVAMVAFILWYALLGSKPSKK